MSNASNKPKLSHVNQHGEANMVDITDKALTSRTATAEGYIKMSAPTLDLIHQGDNKKGDVFCIHRLLILSQ